MNYGDIVTLAIWFTRLGYPEVGDDLLLESWGRLCRGCHKAVVEWTEQRVMEALRTN